MDYDDLLYGTHPRHCCSDADYEAADLAAEAEWAEEMRRLDRMVAEFGDAVDAVTRDEVAA